MNFFFVAGFDFGTSYSKVVIRDQLSGVAKAVTFGPSYGGLFPSFVRMENNGVFGPETPANGTLVSYPKLLAADAATGKNTFNSLRTGQLQSLESIVTHDEFKNFAMRILTRYFLSVLDSIHQFILNDPEWKVFDVTEDPLVVQLAVPSGMMSHHENKVEKMMQEALAAATLLRDNSRTNTRSSSTTELSTGLSQLQALNENDRKTLDGRCITYPEVAAGVQTILRSRNTPDGKYITLDVGAGTIDLNAFQRRSQTEKNDIGNVGLNYWACQVKPLGFARIKLPLDRSRQSDHETVVNPLPEEEVMRGMNEAISKLMDTAFRYQPYESDGDGPSPWYNESYAYIWGGGSEYSSYSDRFLSSLEDLNIGIHMINKLETPLEDFNTPGGIPFGRLAVAYGLSFHQTNLETVRLPNELQTYKAIYGSTRSSISNSYRDCPCKGNPSCYRCHGSGILK